MFAIFGHSLTKELYSLGSFFCLTSSTELLPLMLLRFTHTGPWTDTLTLFIAKYYSVISCVVRSAIDGHSGFCHFLASINKPVIKSWVQGFVWTYTFTSLRSVPGSRIAGAYGMSMFNILMNHQNVFQSSAILHSHQQRTRAPGSPHSPQHLLLSVFKKKKL